MGNVLDLGKFRKNRELEKEEEESGAWVWGIALCWACRWRWGACMKEDTDKSKLECPDCGTTDSAYLDGEETRDELNGIHEKVLEWEKE